MLRLIRIGNSTRIDLTCMRVEMYSGMKVGTIARYVIWGIIDIFLVSVMLIVLFVYLFFYVEYVLGKTVGNLVVRLYKLVH